LVGLLLLGGWLSWVAHRAERRREVEHSLRLDGHLRAPLPRSVKGWTLGLGEGPPPALEAVDAAQEVLARHGALVLSEREREAALSRLRATALVLRQRAEPDLEFAPGEGEWGRAAAGTIFAERGQPDEAFAQVRAIGPGALRTSVAELVLGRELGLALARSAACADLRSLEAALERPHRRARQLEVAPAGGKAWAARAVAGLERAASAWRARLGGAGLRVGSWRQNTASLERIGREVPTPGPTFAAALAEARAELDVWALARGDEALLRHCLQVAERLFLIFPELPESPRLGEVVRRLAAQRVQVEELSLAWAMLRCGVLPQQGNELLVLGEGGGPQRLTKIEPRSRAAAFWSALRLHRERRVEDRATQERIVALCRQARAKGLADLHSSLVAFACVFELNAYEHLSAPSDALEITAQGLACADPAAYPSLVADLLEYRLRELLASGRSLREVAAHLESWERRLFKGGGRARASPQVIAIRRAWAVIFKGARSKGTLEVGSALAAEFLREFSAESDEAQYLAHLLRAQQIRAEEGDAAALAAIEPHLETGSRYSEDFVVWALRPLCANDRRGAASRLLDRARAAHPDDARVFEEAARRLGLLR